MDELDNLTDSDEAIIEELEESSRNGVVDPIAGNETKTLALIKLAINDDGLDLITADAYKTTPHSTRLSKMSRRYTSTIKSIPELRHIPIKTASVQSVQDATIAYGQLVAKVFDKFPADRAAILVSRTSLRKYLPHDRDKLVHIYPHGNNKYYVTTVVDCPRLSAEDEIDDDWYRRSFVYYYIAVDDVLNLGIIDTNRLSRWCALDINTAIGYTLSNGTYHSRDLSMLKVPDEVLNQTYSVTEYHIDPGSFTITGGNGNEITVRWRRTPIAVSTMTLDGTSLISAF